MSAPDQAVTIPPFLRPLRETLLIQCYPSEVSVADGLAERDNSGLVITAELGSRAPAEARREVYRAASHLHRIGRFNRPVLVDAARYAGSNRVGATGGFDPNWIRDQRSLGLPVLTDSGYVAEGDNAGLDSILQRTRTIGDAVALLPLHLSWLRERARCDILASRIKEAGVPVALILEHQNDPFDLVGVVPALLRVLAAGPPVLLLRCDVSAVGALCVGALAAAVGTRTGLRHLYPQSDGGGGGGHPPMIAAVIRECMSYLSLERITQAAKQEPEDTLWRCDCDACKRVPITELAIHSPQRQEQLAFEHSVQALMDLRDKILTPGSTVAQRAESWRVNCSNAQNRHLMIAQLAEKADPPRFLGRWYEALATASLKQRAH